MRSAEKIKNARLRAGKSQQEPAGEADTLSCTLREPVMSEDMEQAVRLRWPEAVRIDWLLLRHDFGLPGRVLNALFVGLPGKLWRLSHAKECDTNRYRYYLVDHFDEHIFVCVQEGVLYLSPLGRRCLNSERDTFRHEGRTYMGIGKISL